MSQPPSEHAPPMSAPPCVVPPQEETAAREPTDFMSVYRATIAPLRRYLAHILGNADTANDVVQDTFVRYHRAANRETIQSPKRFLFTVGRHLAINRLRAIKRDPVHAVDSPVLNAAPSQAPSVHRIVEARSELQLLEELLLQLTPACRQVFLLRRLHDLSHEEISERLGISRKTVESHLTHACRLLREAYAAAQSVRRSP